MTFPANKADHAGGMLKPAAAADEIVSWAGKPVAEMTRDELHTAFQQLGRMFRDERREVNRQFDVLRQNPLAKERT